MAPEELIREFWPDLVQVRIAPLTNVAGTEITAWEVKALTSDGVTEACSDPLLKNAMVIAELWLRKRRNGDYRFDQRVLAILRGDF